MTWTTIEKHWNDTSVEYCDVCGNLLVNRYWRFTDESGVPRRACRPDDEELAVWLADQRAQHPAPWATLDG